MEGLMQLMPALLALAIVTIVVRAWLRRSSRLKQDFDWYISSHPERYVNGKVSCLKCGSAQIRTRAMMNHQYMAAHSCGQCGTTLYYSPEPK